MVSLPFTDPVATPAVVTPTLKVRRQGSSDAGLGQGALDLLGASPNPDAWMAHLLSMRMTLACGDHVDNVVLHLLETEQTPATALGDRLQIALGYGDDGETPLFSGTVAQVETTLSGYRRLVLTSPLLQLAQGRLNGSFEEQSAGDIIRALLGETDVTAGEISPGSQYPFYVVSDRSPLLAHINVLCQQQNWLCYCGADGSLNARTVGEKPPVRTLAYGVDLLELRHWQRSPALAGVKVVGDGAAASKGADAWNWLTKETQATGEAGAGNVVVSQGALRDNAASKSFAQSILADSERAANRVQLQTSAAPDILPGAPFDISGAPTEAANGTFVAERVVISYDQRSGFISTIKAFNRAAGTGDGAGPGGGLL